MTRPQNLETPVRRRTSRKKAPPKAPLSPDRIAFLGAGHASTQENEAIYVQSMCWAIVPDAWSRLAHEWQSLCPPRDDFALDCAETMPESWVSNCAPQLAAPFFEATSTMESSIAALLLRTPVQIALVVIDGRDYLGASTANEAMRLAFGQSLGIYDRFARMPGRVRCTKLLSRSQTVTVDREHKEEFARCRSRMAQSDWLRDMELLMWSEPVEPLPLELAHIIASSAVRHRLDEYSPNPIFNAVRTKLAHTPAQLKPPRKAGRR